MGAKGLYSSSSGHSAPDSCLCGSCDKCPSWNGGQRSPVLADKQARRKALGPFGLPPCQRLGAHSTGAAPHPGDLTNQKFGFLDDDDGDPDLAT